MLKCGKEEGSRCSCFLDLAKQGPHPAEPHDEEAFAASEAIRGASRANGWSQLTTADDRSHEGV